MAYNPNDNKNVGASIFIWMVAPVVAMWLYYMMFPG